MYAILQMLFHLGQKGGDSVSKQSNEILSSCFLLEGLSAEEKAVYVDQVAPPEAFEKGSVIYATDRFSRALGILEKGEAQAVRLDEDGHRILMNTLRPGDSFGAAALFGDTETYVSNIVATKPCEVWFLPQSQLEGWMQRDFRIARRYIAFLSGRIRFLNQRIAGFTGGSSKERLLAFLQQHTDEDGRVVLPCSRSDLAKALDVGRSSLYRSLDELEETGIIRQDNRQIWILQKGDVLK